LVKIAAIIVFCEVLYICSRIYILGVGFICLILDLYIWPWIYISDVGFIYQGQRFINSVAVFTNLQLGIKYCMQFWLILRWLNGAPYVSVKNCTYMHGNCVNFLLTHLSQWLLEAWGFWATITASLNPLLSVEFESHPLADMTLLTIDLIPSRSVIKNGGTPYVE